MEVKKNLNAVKSEIEKQIDKKSECNQIDKNLNQNLNLNIDKKLDVINLKNTPKNKNICYFCNKKTKVNFFGCKCGHDFCSDHRYTFSHNCNYDHKNDQKKKINKHNPVIIADKLEKI